MTNLVWNSDILLEYVLILKSKTNKGMKMPNWFHNAQSKY